MPQGTNLGGASSGEDRATRASTEPQEGLDHSASVPCAAHTPGPWQWVGDDEIEQTEHPFTSVAEVVPLPKNLDPERKQRNANARLIAAAPELYEALNKCRAIIKFHVKDSGVCCTLAGDDRPFSALEAFQEAVAALAKADGNQ